MKKKSERLMRKRTKRILMSLLKVFEEEGVVEMISKAEDSEKAFYYIRSRLRDEIEALKKDMVPSTWNEVTPEEAKQIVTICLMAGVDDIDLIEDYEILPQALACSDGRIERAMYAYLIKGKLFSRKETQTLVKQFFG
ncbi:MAG: hypothetical protein HFJ33_00270 [Clostridia bacterium]|nr:hypothetical protein [Clostridia bacterium]